VNRVVRMLEKLSSLLRRKYSPSELGRRGERRAASYYRLRGYRIVSKNARYEEGEIDLVVKRWRVVAFVEVKTRQGLTFGAPHEAVDQRKRQKLFELAERYLRDPKLSGCDVRFDVVSLLWNGFRFELTHYGDAFRPIAAAGRPWKWSGSGRIARKR